MKNSTGFSLIELMVTVAVVGILAAISYPSYQAHILKSHRPTAINGILDVASRQARYYTTNNSYTTSMVTLGYAADPNPVPGSNGSYYEISVASVTAAGPTTPAGFTIQAVPQGNQVNDSCGTFTYADLGVKAVSSGSLSECWPQ